MRIRLPHVFAIDFADTSRNLIRQLAQPSRWIEGEIQTYDTTDTKGQLVTASDGEKIFVVEGSRRAPGFAQVLRRRPNESITPTNDELDLTHLQWVRHPLIITPPDFNDAQSLVLTSWSGAFSYLEEDDATKTPGLREPQLGALHAIKAHWAVASSAATVVMPTGTGKTETMLCTLVAQRCQRILVIVPTDALRTQIATKFLTLGVLKEFGIIADSASFPVVGILLHKPTSESEAENFISKCNLIVTTSSIAGQSADAIQNRIASLCSHLFIDEAHHVSATTWNNFKERFSEKTILQFTATPFREDDKPVEGKIIFKYPLPRAQERGYFSKINFKGVRVFARRGRDEAIAAAAVEQLRLDLVSHPHILMARVNTIDRAKEVFEIYARDYPEFNPVQIHTGIKSKRERNTIKAKLLGGESRIVVCVDMLGEGFDLPELKIAAFHDIRQSPTVTIQLAGRFTRPRTDLGDATFVANTGAQEVREELRKLYTQDPDWNFLLPELSEELIQEQIDLSSFAEGFVDFPKDVPIQTLAPALSTVIYKTDCDNWTPQNYAAGILGAATLDRNIYSVNETSHTLIIITAKKVLLPWTHLDKIFTWDWNLYVVFWDKDQNLLFINNSTNSGDFKNLAKAVCGDSAHLVKGDQIFRAFGNVHRIVFNNVGLNEHLGKLVSYTGRMGSNVEPVLTTPQRQRASKSVLFGTGYTNGQRASIGCSSKGRVWSHGRAFQLNKLINWCSQIGARVLDESIDPDDYLKNTLVPQEVTSVPDKQPFAIDWNREIYKTPEDAVSFCFNDGTEVFLYEIDIVLIDPKPGASLIFELRTDDHSEQFEYTVENVDGEAEARFTNVLGPNGLEVSYAANTGPAEAFFGRFPPIVWFTDGSEIHGTTYTPLRKSLPPFDAEKIVAWDWTGTDIRKESQGPSRTTGTIQHRVIRELTAGDYEIIFDDDAAGEAADVVAIKVVPASDNQKLIHVELYHCKYSTADTTGARVGELYEVCGQTQRSIKWMDNPSELFRHLLRREEKRITDTGVTRFEKGNADKLNEILEMSRLYATELSIVAVQPGLSKAGVSASQLALLGVTETYLTETYLIPFSIIASA